MCFPPWLPALSPTPLPPSPSPCKFEKGSPRLATHLARKNIYTHVCSQPYKSPGLATWQWEHRRALFLPAQAADSPRGPSFPYSDTFWSKLRPKAAFPLWTHFSGFGSWSQTLAWSLSSTPSPRPRGNSSSNKVPTPRRPHPHVPVPKRSCPRGAGGHH